MNAQMQTPGGNRAFTDTKPTYTPIIAADSLAHNKREATLTAECAMVGVVLIPSHDERGRRVYIVSRWALTKELADLDAVEQWLNRVRGPAA